MKPPKNVPPQAVIDSLGDGVYACDPDRTITYWSKSAERITGWKAEDVLGRKCSDNVLCHIDKDGHRLCGEEYCPLHRSMTVGSGSKGALLVYAKGKDGKRIPMLVSVAPIRDPEGQVIGGVETFRDASETVQDLERAQAIQQLALQNEVPEDPRVTFSAHYVPHEFVGGDFYGIEKLDDDRYGIMLADVMGHGVAAALYTMHLSALWSRFRRLLEHPAEFTAAVNDELAKVVKDDESFATAACGVLDLKGRTFRFAGAGGPPILLMHSDGMYECAQCAGLPLAILPGNSYEETTIDLHERDRLLFFSDGALEVADAEENLLGIDGLVEMLKRQGYPSTPIQMEALEEELLKYSNSIRLEDDLTLIEVVLQ